jgi:D-3-phosphoglycerate dehydrogenase/C-terminal binding protein
MKKRFRVVITDYITDPETVETLMLGDVAEVVAANASNEKDLAGVVEQADTLLVYHYVHLTEQTISRLARCQLIVRCGVGYDNVDTQAARARGIPVANVPDYGTEEVADSAIGLTLSLTRGIALLDRRMREERGAWTPTEAGALRRLRGREFGIIGFGRIGKATALRAKALGMDVVFYDPYVPDGTDKSLGVRRTETLDELLQTAHIISLHCLHSAETHKLINHRTLSQMQPGAYLINTARGACVELDDVLDALTSGHLAGVALDVLPQEPPDVNEALIRAWRDSTHPASDRLIVQPHAAFYSVEGLLDMRVKACENVRRVLEGHPPRNIINP